MFRQDHIRLHVIKERKPALQLISQRLPMPISIAQEILGIGLRKGVFLLRGLPHRRAQDSVRMVLEKRLSTGNIRYRIDHLTSTPSQFQTNGGKPEQVAKASSQFPTT